MSEFGSEQYIAELLKDYPGKKEGSAISSPSDEKWNVKEGDCFGSSHGGFFFDKNGKEIPRIPKVALDLLQKTQKEIGSNPPNDLCWSVYKDEKPRVSEYKSVVLGDLLPGGEFMNGAATDWEGEWHPNYFTVVEFTTKVKGAKGCKRVDVGLLPKGIVFSVPRYASDKNRHQVVSFPSDMIVVVKK